MNSHVAKDWTAGSWRSARDRTVDRILALFLACLVVEHTSAVLVTERLCFFLLLQGHPCTEQGKPYEEVFNFPFSRSPCGPSRLELNFFESGRDVGSMDTCPLSMRRPDPKTHFSAHVTRCTKYCPRRSQVRIATPRRIVSRHSTQRKLENFRVRVTLFRARVTLRSPIVVHVRIQDTRDSVQSAAQSAKNVAQ